MAIEMARVKKGDILITEEFQYGQTRLLYGPVFLIDFERNEVAIQSGEDIRSFPPNKLWTIPAFLSHKLGKETPKVLPPSANHATRVLAGFLKSVLEGNIDQANQKDVLEELKKKNLPETRIQAVYEVMMRL